MDIDMTALRSLESEKDISLDVAVKAIEDALLIAYNRTEGAAPKARVELDRETGHVTVWATETDENGEPIHGLYACGNDLASIFRGTYPGPGTTIGPAVVFGWRVAKHAAGKLTDVSQDAPDVITNERKKHATL